MALSLNIIFTMVIIWGAISLSRGVLFDNFIFFGTLLSTLVLLLMAKTLRFRPFELKKIRSIPRSFLRDNLKTFIYQLSWVFTVYVLAEYFLFNCHVLSSLDGQKRLLAWLISFGYLELVMMYQKYLKDYFYQ